MRRHKFYELRCCLKWIKEPSKCSHVRPIKSAWEVGRSTCSYYSKQSRGISGCPECLLSPFFLFPLPVFSAAIFLATNLLGTGERGGDLVEGAPAVAYIPIEGS